MTDNNAYTLLMRPQPSDCITYMCPECQRFADKKRGYYDLTDARGCVYLCPDCHPTGLRGLHCRWFDKAGEEVITPGEITMPSWPMNAP